MNIMLIMLASTYLICSILFVVKKRAYIAAAFFLAIAVYASTLIRTSVYVVRHEPMMAFNRNDILVVLDSNKNVYIDSMYFNGKICLDEEVSKNIYGNYSYEKMSLNTRCQ